MNLRSFPTSDEPAEPEQIAEEIEATRNEMSETIDAIQERLDPERLTDQAVTAATEVTVQARDAAKEVVDHAIDEAKTAVRELAGQARDAVRDSTVGRVELMARQTRAAAESTGTDIFTLIRQNPIPAALAAVGIGWLWMQRANASSYHYHYGGSGYGQPYGAQGRPIDAAGQVVGQAQHKLGEVVGQAQETAGQFLGQAQGTTGELIGQAEQRADQMQEMTRSTLSGVTADPLAIGALGFALGAVAALLLPETEQENQLLGDAKSRLVGRVQETAGETIEKVQRVAAEVGDTAMREAKAQGIAPEEASASSSA